MSLQRASTASAEGEHTQPLISFASQKNIKLKHSYTSCPYRQGDALPFVLADLAKTRTMDRNPTVALIRSQTMARKATLMGITLPPSPWEVNRARSVRAMVCFCTMLAAAAMLENTWTLYQAPISKGLSVPQTLASVAFTILIITYASLGPAFSKFGSLYGIRSLMMLCFLFTVVAYAGLINMNSVAELYIFYFIGGLAIGSVYAPCTVACIQLLPSDKQGIGAGLASLAYLAGSVIVSPPVGTLIRYLGFRKAFIVQGSASLILQTICILALPKTEEDTSGDEGKDEEVDSSSKSTTDTESTAPISRALFATIYIAYFFAATGYYFVEAEVKPIIQGTLTGWSPVIVITVPICIATNGIARFLWGSMASKFPGLKVLGVAGVIATASFLCWFMAAPSPYGEFACAVTAFFATPAVWPLMPLVVTRIFGEKDAAGAYALLNTADVVASVIAAPALTALAGLVGWPKTLAFASAFPGIMSLLCLGVLPSK